MTRTYSTDGETITRDDGSEVYPVVYRDGDGKVCGKAFVPAGHTPSVPDYVGDERSETVTVPELESTDIHDDYVNSP